MILDLIHLQGGWGSQGKRRHTSSQSILKNLLKPKEFQNGQINSRMESQSSLIRAQSGIELHAVSTVDLDLVLVVFPDDTELNDTFGDGYYGEGGFILGVLLKEGAVFEGRGKLYGKVLIRGEKRGG